MHSLRQRCRSALQGSRVASCIYVHGSQRAFSTTRPCARGALPVFLEASTPELSSLLSTLNSKILLPAHLTKEQEKLVYRNENRAKLEAEPVEITLGHVTLPLEHLDRNRLPPRWATFRDILGKSETREDFENVVRMLEGFENAGINIASVKQAAVVRHLGLNDMNHLVLKALQRAKATGLRMRDWTVMSQVLRAIYDKAALADWDQEETTKALRFARQVVELLENEEHQGGRAKDDALRQPDLRGDPAVIAVPTALAAVLALRHNGDIDEVKTLAGRLMAALQQHDYHKTLETVAQASTAVEGDFEKAHSQASHVVDLSRSLRQLVYINNALNSSIKALSQNMPMAEDAQKYESSISQVLKDGLAAMQRLRTRNGKDIVTSLADTVKVVAEKTGF